MWCPRRTRPIPTGIGDAFRAGFLTGRSAGLEPRAVGAAGLDGRRAGVGGTRSAGVGWDKDAAMKRMGDAYGADAAAEIASALA